MIHNKGNTRKRGIIPTKDVASSQCKIAAVIDDDAATYTRADIAQVAANRRCGSSIYPRPRRERSAVDHDISSEGIGIIQFQEARAVFDQADGGPAVVNDLEPDLPVVVTSAAAAGTVDEQLTGGQTGRDLRRARRAAGPVVF